MNLFYQGADITQAVRVKEAVVLDYGGGKSDRLELFFDDPDRQWVRWNPQKGDVLKVSHGAYRTGEMYLDEIRQRNGAFQLGAVSVPPALRNSGQRAWQSVRLSALIAEFAARADMPFALYGMEEDPFYPRLQQAGAQDIAWLANQCLLERCMVKVTAGGLAVWHEPWLEARAEVSRLSALEGTAHEIRRISANIYAGCRVSAAYTGQFAAPGGQGPWLTVKDGACGIQEVTSQGEADRYAQGILRAHNKWEYQADFYELPLLPELAAGSLVRIDAAGVAFPGTWVVAEAVHRLVAGKTKLKLRKPLEGY